MSTVNKAEKTYGRLQYHIRCNAGDVGKYVFLPGDPARSDRLAKYLTNPRLVASNREYRTFTGEYEGVKVSVCSTGIGCPSASIAVEELSNIGAEAFIRIGSTAALQPGIRIGDLIISIGSMKNEGTSRFYVPDTMPAVPDFRLTQVLVDTSESMMTELGYNLHVGINVTDDAFYGETPKLIEKFSQYGLLNVEMESSAIFTVARARGKKAAMICAVSGNIVTGDVIYEEENPALAEGWENEIRVALEAIKRYDKLYGADGTTEHSQLD
ncbi:MAG: nucleoside phosphorylase [Firmicutes bacterium]|jgi:uridine phosphorylase|nr:nucleoside phosphorylase [Bacillota bacterium]